MPELSIIIPSRSPEYLQKTINDIFAKAKGTIEVIVVFDGIWPEFPIDPRVIVIHQGTVHESLGMREAINRGVAISKGKYIMKCDEHVMFDEGFDVKLIQDTQEDWVVIPRRYRLDAEKWEIIEDGRPPIDYMRIDYPYQRPYDKTCGLHGAEDRERYEARKDILIDETMSWQGSCWFMARSWWDKVIVRMEDENYGPFTQEAQEIGNKTWLSGGKLMVNKKTWYAHLHKGNKGKGYGFSTEQYRRHCEANEKGRIFCIEYWLNTKEFKYDFDWLLKRFWPIKGWPENYKEQILIDREKDYSTTNYENDEWLQGLRK